jgi:hypothetical protein
MFPLSWTHWELFWNFRMKKRENVLEEKSISCGKSFVCSPVYYKKFHLNVILKRKLTKLIKTLPTFRSVLIKRRKVSNFLSHFYGKRGENDLFVVKLFFPYFWEIDIKCRCLMTFSTSIFTCLSHIKWNL